MIIIVDYGMGNLRSVLRKMERLKIPAAISDKEEDLRGASKLIIPGVGHFAMGMKNLHEKGLVPILNDIVLNKKTPVLGICLGMQLFTEHSEEGNVNGLGWIPAKTIRFNFENSAVKLRVPHVGWNTIQPRRNSPLFNGVDLQKRFYFTHSYYVKAHDEQYVIARTGYGEEFDSALNRGNIYGTQFHPEKSHYNGLHVIENFCKL